MLFAVRLTDLSAIEGLDLTRWSHAEIIERLRRVFDFLPKETIIEVADGIATINIPDSATSDKSEADRLHSKATQRAKQGDYRKAVGIWERVIELDPANIEARRNLGMAYVELLETDKAREHLIEAAALDPKDAWSYVVLGNILAKKDDLGGAERFLTQALQLKPEDGWALNSLGAICTERHEYDERNEIRRQIVAGEYPRNALRSFRATFLRALDLVDRSKQTFWGVFRKTRIP
jgi:tetratricopeptide (TPR) repeat protein